MALSATFLNTPRNGDSTNSLRSPRQRVITLSVKKFLLMSNLNLPLCTFRLSDSHGRGGGTAWRRTPGQAGTGRGTAGAGSGRRKGPGGGRGGGSGRWKRRPARLFRRRRHMGKKRSDGLGRSLQRQRGLERRGASSWLHASEVVAERGPELRSAPEQSPLEEFLATAELAGTRFVAERLNAQIVSAQSCTGLLTAQEAQRVRQLHQENQELLRIPRRPQWDRTTSAEDLKQAERESFLEWRRQLAHLEEEKKLILTPFERNLEFWRQLWRVIERSDIVVQIVDARNPLLFRCQDLESYVKEVSNDKENMILINKADLLSEEQRAAWAQFFEKEGVKVVFWSALAECERLCGESKELGAEGAAEHPSGSEEGGSSQEDENTAPDSTERASTGSTWQSANQVLDSDNSSDEYEDCEDDEEEDWQTCSEDEAGDNLNAVGPGRMESRTDGAAVQHRVQEQNRNIRNFSHLVQRNELLEIFKTMHNGPRVKDGEVNVGLVGYPNVGKSSTINTILGNKKVSVSATPGRTKHFQTLYVEPGLCLCDCPGLVMPSFVSTKAEMICSGILPIDQMRDHVPPVSLVCQHIPRNILEATYGINIIRPREDEDPDRKPTAEELLTAYGYMRGFMTSHGQPDQPRSARYVLKDYVSGKLLYCHPPPGIDPNDFQHQHQRCPDSITVQATGQVKPEKNTKAKQIENVVDKTFFHQENVRALMKGVRAAMGYRPGCGLVPAAAPSPASVGGKPWKKHGNRNKKEKIRRITKHLEA
ncbi:large subunit GTPase 1 homolog [Passer montanus]|uniref:large subunit GTPase 1 homolog n=1 Tax=Passer montanus TaxID=9160 RepID=UPI001961140B|nr:large subunit GTPase 1 homolog [Passer montanus]